MAWYLDDVRIYVTDKNSDHKQIVSRLQPLNNGTIHHVFGYENRTYKVTGYVVGPSGIASIADMTRDGALHTFSQPFFDVEVFVNSASIKETPFIYQTIDPTQDCETRVYIVDLDLYSDDIP